MFPPRFAQKSVAFAVFSGSACAEFSLLLSLCLHRLFRMCGFMSARIQTQLSVCLFLCLPTSLLNCVFPLRLLLSDIVSTLHAAGLIKHQTFSINGFSAPESEPLQLDGFLGVATALHSWILSSLRGMWEMQEACDNTWQFRSVCIRTDNIMRLTDTGTPLCLCSKGDNLWVTSCGSGVTEAHQWLSSNDVNNSHLKVVK